MDLQAANHVITKALLGINEGAREEFLAAYKKGPHAKAWKAVSPEVRKARQAAADKEWKALIAKVKAGKKTTHDLAMWLQKEGYRLSNLKAAQAQWNKLAKSESLDEAKARMKGLSRFVLYREVTAPGFTPGSISKGLQPGPHAGTDEHLQALMNFVKGKKGPFVIHDMNRKAPAKKADVKRALNVSLFGKKESLDEARGKLGNLKPFVRALLDTVRSGLKGAKGVSVDLTDGQTRYTYYIAIWSPVSVKMGPTRYFVDGTWLQKGGTYAQVASPAGSKAFTLNVKGDPASIGKEVGRKIVKHYTHRGP